MDGHLPAGIALGFQSEVLERHGEQRNGDLLAGCDHHVQFARIGLGLDLLCQGDQAIGLARHGRYHHHQLVALGPIFGHPFRDVSDAFGASD